MDNKVNGLKNLVDVPVAEDATNLNLIVNDDGEVKQIEAGKVGAQADWDCADESSPAFIKNKPEVPDEQVQADWNCVDETNKAFIKNKPEVPAEQVQADWDCVDETNKAFIKNKPTSKPLVLYADQDYTSNSDVGDEALNAVLTGRRILVRVPNADGGNYTAIYSPVLMYQLPNYANSYLYLFFLRDEKQDLSAVVPGMLLPTYGQLKLKLSKEYNSCPLEDIQ